MDKTTIGITASWDTAQMNGKEMNGHLERLVKILGQLTDSANLNAALRDIFEEEDI